MQKIEINEWGDIEIYCPFCGTKVWSEDGIETCPHILFHACDEGFEFIRDGLDFEEAFEEQDDLSIDEFTDKLEIPDAIKLALYQPAPSFFGAYIAFTPGL